MAKKARKNNKKVTNPYRVANPELEDAMRAKASSNCCRPHDSRPNRQRSRQDAKRHSINNSGW